MGQSDDVPLQVKGKDRSNQSSVSGSKSEQSNQELLVEEIPSHIQDLLPDLKNSPLEVALATDLHFSGNYGQDWLLATNDKIIAAQQNGLPEYQLQQIDLKQIDKVEILNLHGNNILKIRIANQGIELARFSKRQADKFNEARFKIEELIQTQKGEDQKIDTRPKNAGRKTRCEKCGKAIPHWSEICTACIDKGKTISRLLKYAVPHWKLLVGGLMMMLVLTSLGLTPPWINKMLMDEVLVPAHSAISLGQPVSENAGFLLLKYILWLFGITIITNAFGAIRSYIMSWAGQHITHDLRTETYSHLNTLSIDYYHKRDTGHIMARMTHDVERLQDFITHGIQSMLRSGIMVVGMSCILLWQNWRLTLLTMWTVPLLVALTIFIGKLYRRYHHIVWRRVEKISTILASTIPGVRVVKVFGREPDEVERFNLHSKHVLEGGLVVSKIGAFYHPTMGFLMGLGTTLVWWAGGRQILAGTMSIGDLTMFLSYMWQFIGPVQELSRLNERFIRAATSAERVFEILDTAPDIANKVDTTHLDEIEGEIEFKDVIFSYDGELNALDGVSFHVNPGEMIGLAGHSGAGKSTLINLITRFYDVNHGQILLDGRDIRDISVESLRSHIGVVLQDPFLFNGSVAENISYSKPDALPHEIIAAAKAANAHDFIVQFSDGYDTVVGERGARVSGGERQRISIARAILKNPSILILDEATSSVDTETESKIQEALERLIQGRTVFAIAHRLSTLKYSNRLLILGHGKIEEFGTHNELLELDGVYAGLCKKQAELSQIRVI